MSDNDNARALVALVVLAAAAAETVRERPELITSAAKVALKGYVLWWALIAVVALPLLAYVWATGERRS